MLLRRNIQLSFNKGTGDCFRACLTSLFGIPNEPEEISGLPTALHEAGEWYRKTWAWLGKYGLEMSYHLANGPIWRNGLWIASVKSLNFEGGTHAIVMHHSDVEHDPSTAKRYEKGTSLFPSQSDAVIGGYMFEVTDPSLLGELVKIQRAEDPTNAPGPR